MLLWIIAGVAGLVVLELLLRATVGERLRRHCLIEYVQFSTSPRSQKWAARLRQAREGDTLTTKEKFELLAVYRWLRFLRSASGLQLAPTGEVAPAPVERAPPPARVLGALRWFCCAETRETIDLVRSDLARDRRLMQFEGRSPTYIRCQQTFVEWREIIGIAFRFVMRLVAAANPLAKLIDRG